MSERCSLCEEPLRGPVLEITRHENYGNYSNRPDKGEKDALVCLACYSEMLNGFWDRREQNEEEEEAGDGLFPIHIRKTAMEKQIREEISAILEEDQRGVSE